MDEHARGEDRGEGRELLRRFAACGDEDAFRSVVASFGGMVHGVALRQTGSQDTAEEVAQRVFIVLAKKAKRVAEAPSVGAWLHRATVLESLKLLREQRTNRKRLAMIKEELDNRGGESSGWKEVLPHLDDAFDRLKAGEREVLMMHYLEGRTFSEVGERLEVSAEAARKRSERALARLANLLRGRGVAVPVTVLGGVLAVEFAKATPASLVTSLSTAALSVPASVAGTSFWQLILTAMQTGKLSMTAAVLVGASIPVGLEITRGQTFGERDEEIARSSTPVGGAPVDRRRAANDAEKITGDRLRSVFRRLEEGVELDKNLELQLRRLIYTLDAAELEVARGMLAEVENYERFREITHAVFARWAELDAEVAIREASENNGRYGYYPLHGAFGTWTVTDSEAAMDWLVTADTPFDLRFMGYEWLRRSVRDDPEDALAILGKIAEGKPEWGETMHWVVADAWGKVDPKAAWQWLDQIGGDLQQKLLSDLVKAAGEREPVLALEISGDIEERGLRIKTLWDVVWWWALDQPDDLLRYANAEDQFGRLEPETLRTIGEGLARNRPAEVVPLGERIGSQERRDEFYEGVLRGVTEANPALLAPAAEALSEEYMQREGGSNTIGGFMREWLRLDHKAAIAWAASLPPGENHAAARAAVESFERNQEWLKQRGYLTP